MTRTKSATRKITVLFVLLISLSLYAVDDWRKSGNRSIRSIHVTAFNTAGISLGTTTTTCRAPVLSLGSLHQGGHQFQHEQRIQNNVNAKAVPPVVLNKRNSRINRQSSHSDALYMQAKTPNNENEIPSADDGIVPRVYSQRWVQLLYLSLLALLSDWICFSVAAAPTTYESIYDHSAASLIDLFLFTNVASCFFVTDIVDKVGLRTAIRASAVLMTVGCWLRVIGSPLPILAMINSSGATDAVANVASSNYPLVVLGTVLVGAAQPFFQCTPPLLSATWFAATERATSTAVALNFNQIGIAVAFLVGGAMATDVPGLANYFSLIAVLCTAVTIGTVLQFENEPDIPPSKSELEKKRAGVPEPPFIDSVRTFFATPGFTQAFIAFICSISITNVVGTFIDELLERGGIIQQLQIDLAGAGFETAILIGGIVIGGYVDKTKQYKNVTLACLLVTAVTTLTLGLTDSSIGKNPILLLLALLGLGMAAGPVQPINAELAVDVTYPGDETAVESVQQIGGNLLSALLIPVAEIASKQDFKFMLLPNDSIDIRGDAVLLCTVAILTILYYNTFNAPLARTVAEE